MLKVTKYKTIAKDKHTYLSFPDIIKSPVEKDRLFLIYREGNSHHPTWSKLVLQMSSDNGETWDEITEFSASLKHHGCVWNCPRLSYVDNNLHIICDQKSSTQERTAMFKTIILVSMDEGMSFHAKETPLPGMVHDKIISFKDKLFCANHKVKSQRNDLIQLVSW